MAKKNKGGRPKEKVSDKVDFDQLAILCEKGMTDKELAKFYKITERTITRWKKDKEFLSVLKRSKEKADSEVVKSLYKRANGFEFNEETHEHIISKGKKTKAVHVKTIKKFIVPDTTAQIFWLKNRMPKEWRDKQEVDHTTKGNEINLPIVYIPDNGRGKA